MLAAFCAVCYNEGMLTDVHTHSDFSADGKAPLAEMVARAKALGLGYLGVSEHFDFEYLAETIVIDGKLITGTTDAAAYFSEIRRLQKTQNGNGFTLLAGAEFGYHPADECIRAYLGIERDYAPDFVVNSVHTVDGTDAWFPSYFEGKSKERAYRRYLETVRESLDAPYSYDIVGHLGYVSRNAPYADRKIRYADFPALYDDILRTVIAKRKILEVNTSSRGAGSDFLPDTDVLARYYALGGRKISFASDAHEPTRILYGRDKVAEALKKIGFTHIVVPFCGARIPIAL